LLGLLVRANQALAGTPASAESAGSGLALALRRAREVLRPGSLALAVCDERSLDDGAALQLGLLARHCDLILLPVSDPLDHALPAAGLLRFADRHARLELDSGDAALRQAWHARVAERAARW